MLAVEKQKRDEEIVDLFNSGKSIKEIATDYHLSTVRIGRIIKAGNPQQTKTLETITGTPPKKKTIERLKKEAIEEYKTETKEE